MAPFSSSFEDAWRRHNDFTFSPPVEDEKSCVYAQRFAAQTEELCQRVIRNPSHVAINQTLLQVCKKYWEWFMVVPKSHRTCVDARNHRCIHAIFRQCFELLKALELSLEPPMLFLPTPPPPPVPPVVETIAGVTLGEIMGEE